MGTPNQEQVTSSPPTTTKPRRLSRRGLTALVAGVAVLVLGASGMVFWMTSTEAHYERCEELLLAFPGEALISRAREDAAWETYKQECGDIEWERWNHGWWRPDW